MTDNANAQRASRDPHLKIAAVKAGLLRGTANCFVRVYTDQGLTGTGETTESVGVDDIVNKDIGPRLAGRDPLDIEGIYYDLWSNVPQRGMGGPYLSAISGIEVALWDLCAKSLGVQLYWLM